MRTKIQVRHFLSGNIIDPFIGACIEVSSAKQPRVIDRKAVWCWLQAMHSNFLLDQDQHRIRFLVLWPAFVGPLASRRAWIPFRSSSPSSRSPNSIKSGDCIRKWLPELRYVNIKNLLCEEIGVLERWDISNRRSAIKNCNLNLNGCTQGLKPS